MTGMLRVPRSRGALNGVLLVLLGIWGGLIAFVGPYFHYAYTPDKAFTYTHGPSMAGDPAGRGHRSRRPDPRWHRQPAVAIFGAWLAALSGAWFVLGGSLSALWHTGGSAASRWATTCTASWSRSVSSPGSVLSSCSSPRSRSGASP